MLLSFLWKPRAFWRGLTTVGRQLGICLALMLILPVYLVLCVFVSKDDPNSIADF